MPVEVGEVRFRDQRALVLLVDVAALLNAAKANASRWYGRACARAAVANAALLLECAANSCLFSLDLPRKLVEELDRLPVISKFDYFLFARTQSHVDRSRHEVQLAGEVTRLRDHLVHPKPNPGYVVEEVPEVKVEYGRTKALSIPWDVRDWDHDVAHKVATAVLCFLRCFFLGWCGLTPGRVTGLLVAHEEQVIREEARVWVTMPASELKTLQKWLPDALCILDLRLPDGRSS